MKILSIESSCDETSAAVVEEVNNKIIVRSHITATSLSTHAKTGGIIPENAAREQVKYIMPVVIKTLLSSEDVKPQDEKTNYEVAHKILSQKIDALAVTFGPGLIGSLLVGVETAKTLSFSFNKPLIPVNHLLAHLFANFITSENKEEVKFPFVGLIVSGAHTDLLYFKNINEYEWLGGTRDDAAGECFDKCARLIGYAYPGGPKISKLAEKGNTEKINLPKVMLSNDFDFSFSGLKTAFMNAVRKEFEVSKKTNSEGYSWISTEIDTLPQEKRQKLHDLCASLESTIIEVLVRKTIMAAEKYNCSTILLGGGVSANKLLIQKLEEEAKKKFKDSRVFSPEKEYCTDNGAMVGAYALLNNVLISFKEVHANPELYFS